MESRSFIKSATILITKIGDSQFAIDTPDRMREQRDTVQREVSALFNGMHNPTLPSAFKLRDAAHRAGYTVPLSATQRLSQFENWSA